MKSCLILVPHPDDEINIVGTLFDTLIANDFYITVVFATYGDYNPKQARTRAYEAIAAKQILGYQEIIFLGYGDGYIDGHPYEDASGTRVYYSHAGHNETYCIDDIKPYCYLKYNEHHLYTRNNLKSDVTDVILDIKPDLIFCIDVDNHPDHRALSLIFDEAIYEILKSSDYRPVILKKFAYLGVYKGADDFYSSDANVTTPCFFNVKDEKLCFPYLWEDRISFRVHPSLTPLEFWNSKVYKTLRCHKSQMAHAKFGRIVNSDCVYWLRRTDNLALGCTINTSSGYAKYLNDFKIVDTDDICDIAPAIHGSDKRVWKPDVLDKIPHIDFVFNDVSIVNNIVIYQNKDSEVNKVHIQTADGYTIVVNTDNTYKLNIKLPAPQKTKSLRLTILEGQKLAFNEIEIYSKEFNKDSLDYLSVSEENPISKGYNFKSYLCGMLYSIMVHYVNAIKLSNRAKIFAFRKIRELNIKTSRLK